MLRNSKLQIKSHHRRNELSNMDKKEPRRKTPTFLLELPLRINAGQARRLRAHFLELF